MESFSQVVEGRRWRTSMLTLCTEPLLLLTSVLFPCGAYHKASASFERESADWCESICGGVCFFCGFDLRSRFREKYNLRGNEAQDFCIHCWCNSCGLAQIRREAKMWINEGPQPRRGPMTQSPGVQTTTVVHQGVHVDPELGDSVPDVAHTNGSGVVNASSVARPGSSQSEPLHARFKEADPRVSVATIAGIDPLSPTYAEFAGRNTTALGDELHNLMEESDDFIEEQLLREKAASEGGPGPRKPSSS